MDCAGDDEQFFVGCIFAVPDHILILKRDYGCDAYKEISADDPEEIWDFMKDSMLRIEVQSFISNYDSTIKNAVESIDLS